MNFRQFSQKYADDSAKDNSAKNSDRRSDRRSVASLPTGQQRVKFYTKSRVGYRRKAATRAHSAPTGDLKPGNSSNSDFFFDFFLSNLAFCKLVELSQADLSVHRLFITRNKYSWRSLPPNKIVPN